MLTAANLTTLASLREEILKKNIFFSILPNQLHACTTSSQNQENPRSYLGLEPTINILEFTSVATTLPDRCMIPPFLLTNLLLISILLLSLIHI